MPARPEVDDIRGHERERFLRTFDILIDYQRVDGRPRPNFIRAKDGNGLEGVLFGSWIDDCWFCGVVVSERAGHCASTPTDRELLADPCFPLAVNKGGWPLPLRRMDSLDLTPIISMRGSVRSRKDEG